jgi:hypothetical protein
MTKFELMAGLLAPMRRCPSCLAGPCVKNLGWVQYHEAPRPQSALSLLYVVDSERLGIQAKRKRDARAGIEGTRPRQKMLVSWNESLMLPSCWDSAIESVRRKGVQFPAVLHVSPG